MNIRAFTPADAAFCFKIRAEAFIKKFHGELDPTEVSACVTAYLPRDYIVMAQKQSFFIVERGSAPAGFFTLNRLDDATAEIPLIYIDLNRLGRGLGAACIRYIENWVGNNWPSVRTLVVDTVIPENNAGFYRKMGFAPEKEVDCEFPDRQLKALRLKKALPNREKNKT